ncbi:TIGR02444 family protein [Simiduia aestuariiviva]|uniref:Uncharacterized protein (TIGR02444 family) n=1 Tax=Simiduia aestuariiviva TaxID=1510459 RepID=A0A839UU04_9GAMM|nr:TIGR02444 family protein [Simiduia aestuariiviva]MBB3169909.1 uncharacterized protein (TIGR02444 family) [Simiduia aestuariiviva]
MQALKDFALWIYGRKDVETECLGWQDRAGVSVPLLLCCAWLDWRGTGCDGAQLHALGQPVVEWERAVVWPIRQLRRQLKPQARTDDVVQALRERIKQTELSAELAVLDKLAALPWSPTSELALNSLASHYQLHDCDPFPALRRAMAERPPGRLTGPHN